MAEEWQPMCSGLQLGTATLKAYAVNHAGKYSKTMAAFQSHASQELQSDALNNNLVAPEKHDSEHAR
eukprot:151325-Chlamydomonas_euryale.AAC.21